jgi:hypothetical protein
MSKELIGYKVVKEIDLGSVIITYGDAHMIYAVGKKVSRKRKYGALCVFKNIGEAKNFSRSWIYTKVYKCKYTKSKLNYLKDEYSKTDRFYSGTVFANSVTLLEEVN